MNYNTDSLKYMGIGSLTFPGLPLVYLHFFSLLLPQIPVLLDVKM